MGYGSGLPGFTKVRIGVADSSTSTTNHECANFTKTEVAINDGGIDMDLRWEADDNENGLVCDASRLSGAGAIGIGKAPAVDPIAGSIESKISIAFPTDDLEIIDYDEDDTTAHDTRAGAIRIRLNGATTSVYIRTWT
jgi:hypothetical protein